jgi:hypothetical protein
MVSVAYPSRNPLFDPLNLSRSASFSGGDLIMGDLPQRGGPVAQLERAIASLIDRTSVSPDEVRRLFTDELARLETSAKVRTHLLALTTSNVRGMLRRDTQ